MAYLWRRLGFEQKVAAVAASLLIVSTFGPFSMVEAAMVLTGLGVIALLRARAAGRRFDLPLGDGTVLILAAAWYALLIVVRVLDRPLGQSVLALACAALLAAAGLRERTRRPPDDVAPPRASRAPAPPPGQGGDETVSLGRDDDATEPLHRHPDETEPLHRPADATEPLHRGEDETAALPPSGPPRPRDPPRPR